MIRSVSVLLGIASYMFLGDVPDGTEGLVGIIEFLMYGSFLVTYVIHLVDRGAGRYRVLIESAIQGFAFYSALNAEHIYMTLGILLMMMVLVMLPVSREKRNRSSVKREVDAYLVSKRDMIGK